VNVQKPSVVRHYRARGEGFHRAANELGILDTDNHSSAIALLSVHACISLADAISVATTGDRVRSDNHNEAVTKLQSWCKANGLQTGGIKHLQWLIGKKSDFAYGERPVESDLKIAEVKMDQFFVWALQTFPSVAELEDVDDG
jgi:hypothetical protein